jgi:hypothetical protein
VNSYQLADGTDAIFAPYALGTVGAGQNTNVGAGVWLFNTATCTNQELISAPADEGLHALVQHEVNFQHDHGEVHMPFQATVGSANVSPDHVDTTVTGDSGSFDVTFKSGIDLDGLKAAAFGLSQPQVTTEAAHQDNPDDPSTASVKRNLTLSHAGHVTITTALAGNESVQLVNPPDGNYQIWVHGFAVSGTPTFPLTVDAVQGNDLTISGVPTLLSVPIVVHRR